MSEKRALRDKLEIAINALKDLGEKIDRLREENDTLFAIIKVILTPMTPEKENIELLMELDNC